MRNLFWLLFIFSTAAAQEKDPIDIALKPFWEGQVMHDESVLMIARDGKPAEASLLFKPKRILSVKNAGHTITYQQGIDWEYKDGKLKLLPGSKAVFMKESELYPDSTKKSFPKLGGGRIRFNEGSFFHEKQLAVTYKHVRHVWKGPVPHFQGEKLPYTLALLRKKQAIHLLLNGDSIAAGANASGRSKAAPNLPDWGVLITEKLKRYYHTDIRFTNTAVGGKDSKWGRDNANELIVQHNPDLVIIAFGMNDGTGKLPPAKFKENLAEIIRGTREKNKNAEFILVLTRSSSDLRMSFA